MERKNLKTLSTGEFASYFGVKKDTLFYYDRINLFKPAGKLPNGYRYYTYDQINTFSTLQSLRKVGVSIEELKEYLNSPNTYKLVEMAKQQTVLVEEEIEKLIQIRRFFKGIISMEEERKNVEVGKVYIQKTQKKSIFLSDVNSKNSMTDFDWVKHFSKQIGLFVPAPIGSVITRESLIQERYEEVDHLFCYSDLETGQSKPGGIYVIYYHQGSYKDIESAYHNITEFIKSEGYVIEGNAYEDYFYNPLRTNNKEEYLTKISIQVTMCLKS
ncbi:MerR family transcriptional regulator [Bacillus wiedmannii]|uniref:MerR family transcriptional regulator n=1 Tax=Bacillus wiedmannii TaxID=1890302 RepID=UPI001F09D6DC|nr:MerR family transcriptional regulator [Bacillus wiedmannii]MCX3316213.1 MerR family transcriptional regulator [Bacillus wiedmannii]MED3078048.1 MerR family transcriptional regulator [Bacillus wiedmannii]